MTIQRMDNVLIVVDDLDTAIAFFGVPDSADDPERVTPRPDTDHRSDPLRIVLPPVSWNVIRLSRA
ncbi:hypothetical protein [Streptosporangium sp. NPDC020145]|uniref:hypothetical protein n=1 Tax=Streptosporangium sp. NPDC020145 TaxID=3154694 RepID=UPI003430A675